jgi:DNA ligase 1
MKFAELAYFFGEMEKTRSRNAMTEMLAEMLKKSEAKEVKELTYLLMGKLGPLYQQVDLGLADKMIMRALALAYAVEPIQIFSEFKQRGDLGEVACILSNKQQAASGMRLTVQKVYDGLLSIAGESRAGSQERKMAGLAALLKQAQPEEAKYIVRLVLGKLRLGFSDKTILDALSVMERGTKQAREALDQAYQVMPDIGVIAELVKQFGSGDIQNRVQVTMGVPVMPALAQRLKSAEEMIQKMGEVLVEPKFDGTRVQIHIRKDTRYKIQDTNNIRGEWEVKTFTRNLEETTWMFPELLKALDQVKADEIILDSEAVGIHPQTGKMLPFQMTITRKRKYGIDQAAIDVPLRFFVFDVLYKDGISLLPLPLEERRKILEQTVLPGKILEIDESFKTASADDLRAYHLSQLKAGLEGVVVKQIRSPYEPGRRGWSWVKFKEVEEASGKLSDTLDCVVMGFYRGQGKRSTFGIGAFLVGIKDQDRVLTVAKIGTGLSDEQWMDLRKRLEESVTIEKPGDYVVDKGLIPDIWVDPVVVVEIAADEITTSPVHSAGMALRFPRLVSFRDDKSVANVTSLAELATIQSMS